MGKKNTMATTKITILQRGGDKSHETIEAAARFFLLRRMSTRLANTISLRIEIRSTKLEAGTLAKVGIPTNGSAGSRAFTITIDRDRPLRDQITDLAHEIVHVEQAATGRYQLRRWKTDGKLHARWEGRDLGLLHEIDYRDRPWEIEAAREEAKLAAAFWRR